MDNRQTSHCWGAFNHISGSYTEPIGGDENPETYGSSGGIPTLSTDAVLANNLRLVNFNYRARQLLPSVRVPGFMSHQTERQFADGQGPATQNYSALYRRDFDMHGFKYSMLSSIGTAGLNNVLAMLPARDTEEDTAFPVEMNAWIRRWLDWTDAEYLCLHNMQPLAALDRGVEHGSGTPRLGFLDGTAAFRSDGQRGFLFLFNPGPRAVCATLHVDEGMGLPNSTTGAYFLAHEIYPREESDGRTTPVGLWEHGSKVKVCVAPQDVSVLRVTAQSLDSLQLPLVLNLTHASISAAEPKSISVDGAVGLSGDERAVTMLTQSDIVASLTVNGRSVSLTETGDCARYRSLGASITCTTAQVKMSGDATLRARAEATVMPPPSGYNGSWFNSTIIVTSAMLAQLDKQQAGFPVQWTKEDMDATWLGNRLKLFAFITNPDLNKTRPRLWVNSSEVTMVAAYNSRHPVDQSVLLGWFFDATHLATGTHQASLLMPPLNGSQFVGLFWNGLSDALTDTLA